ncbi:hypothetical protein GCM10010404_46020 [Nonomuraea africana]
MKALARVRSRRVDDDAADDGVGAGGAAAERGQSDRPRHVQGVAFRYGTGRAGFVHPRTSYSPVACSYGGPRGMTGCGERTTEMPGGTPDTRALPPIRTFTVGPGISPSQPADGIGRVADCHRRFGLSPTPEHASSVRYQFAMPEKPDATTPTDFLDRALG